MRCNEKGCGGMVSFKVPYTLQTGCSPTTANVSYPCTICGRLHWIDGKTVFNRPGHRAFLINNEIVHKDKNNQTVDYSISTN